MTWVYLVRCKDHTIYCGITDDLTNRMEQHRSGRGARHIKHHGFGALVYDEQHSTKAEAMRREREIKGWSRARKLKLISSRAHIYYGNRAISKVNKAVSKSGKA